MKDEIEAPDHKPKLPPTATFASDKDRWLAETLSVVQQDMEWLIRHTVIAHNIAQDNNKFIAGLRSPVKILGAILVAAAIAYASAKAERWAYDKDKDKPSSSEKPK